MKTSSTTTSSAPGHLKRPHKSTEHKSKQQVIDDLSRELDQQKLACEAQAKDIQQSQARLQESSVGFEAMVVLFKYITENLDGLRCPELKRRLAELTEQLNTAQQQLDGAARLQNALEMNMRKMKEQHQKDISILKSSHEETINELKLKLQKEADQEIKAAETEHKQQLEHMQQQAQNLLSDMKLQHDSEIACVTQEYEVKLDGLKTEFTHQLEALKKSYEARINNVTKHYEEIKEQLTEKNVQLHSEYQILMKRDGSEINTPDGSRTYGPLLSHKFLEQEVESLRAVMELRNQEINQLRMHNDHMEKQLEEIPKAQVTITALQQKIENLEAIINLKADYERDLAEKHNVLLRKYDQETKAKKRLSMNNEELVYKLNQSMAPDDENESESAAIPQTNRPKSVLASSGNNSTSSTPSKTREHRPKSMVALPQQGPSPASKASLRQSGPPVSAKPPGIKLRRPKMFSNSPEENTSSEIVSDGKQDAFRQSDV